MLKRILMGAGMAYLARRFMGGRRSMSPSPMSTRGWGRRGW